MNVEYTLMRQTKGNPLVLKSFDELDGKSGFVFAPFYINDSHPLLLLQPNVVGKAQSFCKCRFS